MNYRELLIRLVSMTTPFVYDDTLTFLEMVRRFNKIINEVLEVIQGLTNDFDSLQEEVETFDSRITTNTNDIAQNESDIEQNAQDIVDLKDYVDNYFDSLNISIVVRQVLNEMVADGTLEQLLNQTILAELNADVSSLKTRVTSLETTTTTQGTQISQLNTRTQVLESDNITNKQSIIALQSSDSQQNTRLTTNESAISTLTTNVGTNTSDISTLQTSVSGLTSDVATIGDVTNLTTTNKATCVGAINEVDANVKKFDFTSFTTYGVNDVTFTGNGTLASCSMTLAKNSDGSIVKLYGDVYTYGSTQNGNIIISNTGVSPSEEINIKNLGLTISYTQSGIPDLYGASVTFKTNGDIYIAMPGVSYGCRKSYFPCVIFLKNFGDVSNV